MDHPVHVKVVFAWFAYLFYVVKPHAPAGREVLEQAPAPIHFPHVYESVRTELHAADERGEAELEEDESGHGQEPLTAHDLTYKRTNLTNIIMKSIISA